MLARSWHGHGINGAAVGQGGVVFQQIEHGSSWGLGAFEGQQMGEALLPPVR